MKLHSLLVVRNAVWVFAISLLACTSSPTSPGIEPEIVGTAESFGYQVSEIANYSGSADYVWHNDGTAANIDLSSVGSSGTATLVVLDAAGAEVFSGSLTQDGTVISNAGTIGNWTIRVIYSSFTGTVNFRVERDS